MEKTCILFHLSTSVFCSFFLSDSSEQSFQFRSMKMWYETNEANQDKPNPTKPDQVNQFVARTTANASNVQKYHFTQPIEERASMLKFKAYILKRNFNASYQFAFCKEKWVRVTFSFCLRFMSKIASRIKCIPNAWVTLLFVFMVLRKFVKMKFSVDFSSYCQ